jgi:hypothetical protein
MKVAEQLTPEQLLAKVEERFQSSIKAFAECHGKDWPEHREFVENYLREQAREYLIAHGWRPKR